MIFDGNVPLFAFPTADIITYVVVKGDNLTRIAQKFYGDGARWREIYNMNKAVIGGNPNLIYAGQVLTIRAE